MPQEMYRGHASFGLVHGENADAVLNEHGGRRFGVSTVIEIPERGVVAGPVVTYNDAVPTHLGKVDLKLPVPADHVGRAIVEPMNEDENGPPGLTSGAQDGLGVRHCRLLHLLDPLVLWYRGS